MLSNLFTTGEFARLCGIKRDTLIHYDEIGLLKPEKVGSNGYRYYGINQMMVFDIISAFKEVGTPLEKIRKFLANKDTNSFLEMIKSKQQEIETEIKKLEKTQRFLSETIDITENAMSAELGKISIEECGEESLIVFEAAPPEEAEIQFMLNLRKHIMKFRQKDYGSEFPMGGITLLDSVRQNNFRESYYYSRISGKPDDEQLFIKPSGTYAVMYYRGIYDNLPEVYADILRRIGEMGYKICGNIYEEDQLYFLSEQDMNNYVIKIAMQVEKGRGE